MSRSSSTSDRRRRAAQPTLTRRALLGAGAALGAGLFAPGAAQAGSPERAGTAAGDRLSQAYGLRVRAAEHARAKGTTRSVSNGDEEAVPARAACFAKALPHHAVGTVEPNAYAALLHALRAATPRDFESIPLGGFVKLANPQAAWAFDLVGPDASQPTIQAPPRFASAEQAGEMVELYWQALTRDVPFAEYDGHPMIQRAAADLSRIAAFTGPREGGRVTPRTLFRGTTPGDLSGPYVSQFLLLDVPFLPIRIEQRIRTARPRLDYLTRWDEWLAIQNGKLAEVNRFDDKPRFIRNGRDLGEYAHRDFTYQAFLSACLTALRLGTLADGGNPYKHSRTQSAFTTFGQPYLLYLLAVVTQVGLKACWHQKWRVHRRVRPEEFGGHVDAHLRKAATHPLPEQLLGSDAVAETRRTMRSALLPQAYPEGCPTHPAYPAGHAVIAGACTTVLKALLDESHVIPDPVVAAPDGLALVPWKGADLTVGGELDKLAFNVAMGRNFAGIHWRSDAAAGLRLGEMVTVQVLEEMKLTGHELCSGWSFRSFAGDPVRTA